MKLSTPVKVAIGLGIIAVDCLKIASTEIRKGLPMKQDSSALEALFDSPSAVLSPQDRCDRCGARAQVRAIMQNGFDVLLCGHHFTENEGKLRDQALEVFDQRSVFAATESTAAAAHL